MNAHYKLNRKAYKCTALIKSALKLLSYWPRKIYFKQNYNQFNASMGFYKFDMSFKLQQ